MNGLWELLLLREREKKQEKKIMIELGREMVQGSFLTLKMRAKKQLLCGYFDANYLIEILLCVKDV